MIDKRQNQIRKGQSTQDGASWFESIHYVDAGPRWPRFQGQEHEHDRVAHEGNGTIFRNVT